MNNLNERFKVTPSIVNMTGTATTIATATATLIAGTSINIKPREAGSGMAFRFKLAGTKTGTNAAHTVVLYLGSTAVNTLTADAATAVDWMAEFTIIFTNFTAQQTMGMLLVDSEDPEVNYAAGTVDCSGGVNMYLMATSHASDSLVIQMATVERLDFYPMSTT